MERAFHERVLECRAGALLHLNPGGKNEKTVDCYLRKACAFPCQFPAEHLQLCPTYFWLISMVKLSMTHYGLLH